MTRSFMLAVSGFALVSAACTPSDDAAMDEAETDGMSTAQEMDSGATSPMDGADMDADQPASMDTDTTTAGPGGADSMDALRQDLLNDMESDAAEAGAMDNEMSANFGMDYAGLWGTDDQCTRGLGWAFSASSVTTPDGEVCAVNGLEEGEGEVMLTTSCTLQDGTSEDRDYTLALQDDGSLSVVGGETDATVDRCMPMTDETEDETETEE